MVAGPAASRSIRASRPRLRRVLVATDFGSGAALAYARIAELPLARDARIYLVRVQSEGREEEPRAFRRGEARLRREAGRLRALLEPSFSRVNVEPALLAGRAAEQITGFASAQDVELTVLGRHGRRPLGDLFGLGTTADRVMRETATPVLVVRRRCTGPYQRPAVGYDLPPSRATVRAIREGRALPGVAAWTAIHIADDLPSAGLRLAHASNREISALQRAEEPGLREELLGDLRRRFPRIRWQVAIRWGDPVRLLSQAADARHADLLAVGTRTHSKLGRRLLGSVAEAALKRCRCDVLAVPPPQRSE